MLSLMAWPRPRGQKTWLWYRPRSRGSWSRPRPRGSWPRPRLRPRGSCPRHRGSCLRPRESWPRPRGVASLTSLVKAVIRFDRRPSWWGLWQGGEAKPQKWIGRGLLYISALQLRGDDNNTFEWGEFDNTQTLRLVNICRIYGRWSNAPK